MATANGSQPGQEQLGNPNLDALQSMLDLIFIQSGRFIKEHQAGGGTGRMKLGMQRAVPVATERFHDALDELENEVRLAQVVLRRDLASLNDARRKRAAAAKQHEADRTRLVTGPRNPPTRSVELPIQVDQADKVDKVSTPAVLATVEKSPEPVVKVDEPGPEPASKREPEHVPSPIKTSVDTPPRDPLFDGTPTTANPQDTDFDFDAIFGDAMDTTADHDNAHPDTMDTSTNLDFNLDDTNDGPSLLRGLEDFAKDSEDDSNNNSTNPAQDTAMDIDIDMDLDIPAGPSNPSHTSVPAPPKQDSVSTPDAKPPVVPQTLPVDPVPQPPSTTSQTPDVKIPTTTAAAAAATTAATSIPATTQEDLMATMATDNLEDLFNMDDYENPENSSFDDAFFNFND